NESRGSKWGRIQPMDRGLVPGNGPIRPPDRGAGRAQGPRSRVRPGPRSGGSSGAGRHRLRWNINKLIYIYIKYTEWMIALTVGEIWNLGPGMRSPQSDPFPHPERMCDRVYPRTARRERPAGTAAIGRDHAPGRSSSGPPRP